MAKSELAVLVLISAALAASASARSPIYHCVVMARRGRVGEHLTELLDRIESARKPEMLSRVFRAYADESTEFHN